MFNMDSIMNVATEVTDKMMSSTMNLVDELISSVMLS